MTFVFSRRFTTPRQSMLTVVVPAEQYMRTLRLSVYGGALLSPRFHPDVLELIPLFPLAQQV